MDTEKHKTANQNTKPIRKRTIAFTFFAMGILATFIAITLKSRLDSHPAETVRLGSPDDVNFYDIKRMKGFENIQPVVSVEPQIEASKLLPLKNELELLVDSLKKVGAISDISIYVKNFKRGDWISINEKAQFHPASLMKVPLMLAVLKTAEANPGLLEKKIVYKKMPGEVIFNQHFQGPSIIEGETYRIHDLIYYCAANSDNRATHALEANVDVNNVLNLFQDIGLPKPNVQDTNYTIGTRDFSRFMEVIFNSTLLSPEFSEYGAEMLANCHFKEGFSKGVPSYVTMWHKFGEWTRPHSEEVELHESAALFMNGKTYLLTVMTRGKDMDTLATVLQKISGVVVKRVVKNPYSIARTTILARNATC